MAKYDHLPPALAELLRMYLALHSASPTKDAAAMSIFAAAAFLEHRFEERAEAEAQRHAQERADLLAMVERLVAKKP